MPPLSDGPALAAVPCSKRLRSLVHPPEFPPAECPRPISCFRRAGRRRERILLYPTFSRFYDLYRTFGTEPSPKKKHTGWYNSNARVRRRGCASGQLRCALPRPRFASRSVDPSDTPNSLNRHGTRNRVPPRGKPIEPSTISRTRFCEHNMTRQASNGRTNRTGRHRMLICRGGFRTGAQPAAPISRCIPPRPGAIANRRQSGKLGPDPRFCANSAFTDPKTLVSNIFRSYRATRCINNARGTVFRYPVVRFRVAARSETGRATVLPRPTPHPQTETAGIGTRHVATPSDTKHQRNHPITPSHRLPSTLSAAPL